MERETLLTTFQIGLQLPVIFAISKFNLPIALLLILFIEYYLCNMYDCHIFVKLFLFSIVIVQFLLFYRRGSYIRNIYWDYIFGNIYMCTEI